MGSTCHDLVMLVAGALIGLIPSLIVLYIQRRLDHRGEIKIYFKIISIPFLDEGQTGWGCHQEGKQLAFLVPMNVELYNTSNVTRVIRDLSIHLYLGTEHIEKMAQIEYAVGKNLDDYGTDNNAYSFTMAPRSIQKQKCLFAYKIYQNQQRAITFDTMKMRYYDEKDAPHEEMIDTGIANCWSTMLYEPDEDWRLLGESKEDR